MYVIVRRSDQKIKVYCGDCVLTIKVLKCGSTRVYLGFDTEPKGSMYVAREESRYQGRDARACGQYSDDFLSGMLDRQQDNA